MNYSPSIFCNPSCSGHICASAFSKFTFPENGLSFSRSQNKLYFPYCRWTLIWRGEGQQSHLKIVAAAELASSSFSLSNSDLDFQDVSQPCWIGPLPGDISEIEAYCRIFRAAENLYTTLMDELCDPINGECAVSSDSLLGDKIASVLGCMVSLLNKGRADVLSGRSSFISSFRAGGQVNSAEDELPPLAVFRREMKRCCESLHVALGSFLMPGYDRSCDVWRKLQRLKNLCYDLGFPREDDCPEHWLIANWESVYLISSKDVLASRESEVGFCKGGQLTKESLEWLLQRGFKTIIDLREEDVKDKFYQPVLDDAIKCGKVKLYCFPVEIGTAPSAEQVEKFASLVSDENKRPVYVHSREGLWRISAMISRWRQYMAHLEFQMVSHGKLAGSSNQILLASESSNDMLKDKILEDEDESRQSHIENQNGVYTESSSGQNTLQKDGGRDDLAHNGFVSGKADTSEEANGNECQKDWSRDINPMRSQLPPNKVFCKKEMSSFFQSRRISCSSFIRSESRVLIHTQPGNAHRDVQGESESTDESSAIGASEVARSVESSLSENMSLVFQGTSSENGNTLTNNGHLSENQVTDKLSNKEQITLRKNDAATERDEKHNGPSSVLPRDHGLEEIEGNMCASTTGVVRVQSRKKAEMFLVRTDGFSCSREKVTESSLAITHPSTQQQMLLWKSVPRTVLMLKKLGPELMEEAKEVASFLHYEEGMNILVEPEVHDMFERIPGFGFVQTFYTQDTSDLHGKVDFVACLGGDGVILHASNLFRGPAPPVVSFNLGSLGFLTSHIFKDYKQDLRQVIHGNNTREGVYITLRMRLRCEIYRHGKMMPGKVFDVLNEVVVDRGSNPYLSKIECYDHGRLITKVQGDGVIIATPTGSTAYSTSAGGSMVHPNVPCMLFTPICPHSLSFRPVILPDSARLELKIPEDARSNAWVSFDGKRRQQLSRGDSIKISMSAHPLPTVNKSDQTGDWFHSLIRCLNWNERLEQKAL